jgi:plastocyanin
MAAMWTLVAGALGALVLAAATPADWSKAQLVTVIQSDYRFDPSDLTVRVGVAYRLRVENRGKDTHELTAPTFFKAIELGNPEALNPERTEIVLQPGEQKDLYFVPRQAGRYSFSCADHDWAGMTGTIVVQ